MANILNCCAIFHRFGSSRMQKQQLLEAEILNFKLQSIDGLFESIKFEKVKGSNIAKCAQKKILFIINKIVPFTRNFSKALVILAWFLLLFLLLFLLIVYISSASHLEVFRGELFRISIVKIYETLVFP